MPDAHRQSELSEPPAQAEHQVVGVLEVVELVAHVEEEAARDERLQRQNLVEAARVLALLDEVAPDADVYREDGHVQLGAEGEAGGKLLAEGRAVELQPVAAGAFDMMRLQVGTFVVLGVEREAGAEVFVDAVHGVEVEARHGKRAGDELGAAVQKETPLAGGAVEDDVVADARGQRRGRGGTGRVSSCCLQFDWTAKKGISAHISNSPIKLSTHRGLRFRRRRVVGRVAVGGRRALGALLVGGAHLGEEVVGLADEGRGLVRGLEQAAGVGQGAHVVQQVLRLGGEGFGVRRAGAGGAFLVALGGELGVGLVQALHLGDVGGQAEGADVVGQVGLGQVGGQSADDFGFLTDGQGGDAGVGTYDGLQSAGGFAFGGEGEAVVVGDAAYDVVGGHVAVGLELLHFGRFGGRGGLHGEFAHLVDEGVHLFHLLGADVQRGHAFSGCAQGRSAFSVAVVATAALRRAGHEGHEAFEEVEAFGFVVVFDRSVLNQSVCSHSFVVFNGLKNVFLSFPGRENLFPVSKAAFPGRENRFWVSKAAFPGRENHFSVSKSAFPGRENRFSVSKAAFPSRETFFRLPGAPSVVRYSSYIRSMTSR